MRAEEGSGGVENAVDREKVIKGLCEALVVMETHVPKRFWGYSVKAIQDALALLKAQEPVKPIRYQVGRWYKTWRCGACGGTLVFRNGEDKPKYCTDCGRAVKLDD